MRAIVFTTTVFLALIAGAKSPVINTRIKTNCLTQYKTLAATSVTPATKAQILTGCQSVSENKFALCVASGVTGIGLAPIPKRGNRSCDLPSEYGPPPPACQGSAELIANSSVQWVNGAFGVQKKSISWQQGDFSVESRSDLPITTSMVPPPNCALPCSTSVSPSLKAAMKWQKTGFGVEVKDARTMEMVAVTTCASPVNYAIISDNGMPVKPY